MAGSWERFSAHRAPEAQVLTGSTGSVALRRKAGMAAPHLVDSDDSELVVDVGGQMEDGGVDTAWEPGVVMPDPWLELVLFKLDDIV